jgi:hypothetical protein
LIKDGKNEEAGVIYELAIKLNPENADAVKALALITEKH